MRRADVVEIVLVQVRIDLHAGFDQRLVVLRARQRRQKKNSRMSSGNSFFTISTSRLIDSGVSFGKPMM